LILYNKRYSPVNEYTREIAIETYSDSEMALGACGIALKAY